MLRRHIRSVTTGLALATASGCAAAKIAVPPSQYDKLQSSKRYIITTRNGEVRETSNVERSDSVLVFTSPSQVPQDQRSETVRIPYSEIQSVETTQKRSIFHVEVGAETGNNFGDESDLYSSTVGIFELGYVSGELEPKKGWDFGGTFMVLTGNKGLPGAKGIARYRFNPNLSVDLEAGPMFQEWNKGFVNGFVGGAELNVFSMLSLRSEYVAYGVDPWLEIRGDTHINHAGGYQQVWYNGAALAGTPAWTTLGIGAVGVIALIVWLANSDLSID